MPKMTITSPYKNKKPATKGISLGAKKADKLFRFMKKEGLLEDRAEYDEDDLKSAYPDLNDKETRLLFLKIQRWKYAQTKKIKREEKWRKKPSQKRQVKTAKNKNLLEKRDLENIPTE